MNYIEIDGNIVLKDEIRYLLTIYKEHRQADFLFQNNFNKLFEIKNEIEKLVIKQMSNYRILSKKHSQDICTYMNRWCAVPATQEMLCQYVKNRDYDIHKLHVYTMRDNTYMYYYCYLGGYTMSSIKIEMLEDRFLITQKGYNHNGINDLYDIIEPYDSIQHDLTITAAMLNCARANQYMEDYIWHRCQYEVGVYDEHLENDTQENIFYNIRKNIYVEHFLSEVFLDDDNVDIISKYRFKDGLLVEGDLSIFNQYRHDIGDFLLKDESLTKYY